MPLLSDETALTFPSLPLSKNTKQFALQHFMHCITSAYLADQDTYNILSTALHNSVAVMIMRSSCSCIQVAYNGRFVAVKMLCPEDPC